MRSIPEAPTVATKTHTSGTAATAFAVDLGASDGERTLNIVCTQAFNIVFNDSATITDPADNAAFPAGSYRFVVAKRSRFFEVTPNANCIFTHWLDRV